MEYNKKKLLFVVNPRSGKHNKTDLVALIERDVDCRMFDFRVVYTEYAGHAEELASEAIRIGVDMVVAVGGDGTVNEVGRALIHTSTALGIIPCGSGNGLARHLHIPLDVQKALATINSFEVKSIDYGKINGHPFFCTCGVGFDAFVSSLFANSKERGPLSYVESVFNSYANYQAETYEIETEDGNTTYQAFLVACANASQYGNNAYIAPHAKLDDGLMDVTIIQPFNLLDAGAIAVDLFAKTLDKNNLIHTLRCRSLHIHRVQQGIAHYDGDPIMLGKDLCIEIIPQGIRVLVGKEEKRLEPANVLRHVVELFDGVRPIDETIREQLRERLKFQ